MDSLYADISNSEVVLSKYAAELVSLGCAGNRIMRVMSACHEACEAIKTFGVTQETMTIFNANGELDKLVKAERLMDFALESLGPIERDLRAQKYVVALEGAVGDAFRAFVAWVKKMWDKIVMFVKTLIDRFRVTSEKVSKMLSSIPAGKLEEASSKFSSIEVKNVYDVPDLTKLSRAISEIWENVFEVGDDDFDGDRVVADTVNVDSKKTTKKVSDLLGSGGIDSLKKVLEFMSGRGSLEQARKIEAEARRVLRDAEKAAGKSDVENAIKEQTKEALEHVADIRKLYYVTIHNCYACVRAIEKAAK